MTVFPRPVLLERCPLELTDVDVVEERLDDERDVAAGQRDVSSFARA
jgi:hypothetical protein